MKPITGAEILVDCLRREKVEVVFGYPGGVVIPIFDVLYDTKDIRFILTRHEQGAAHMADGYARATGKVGVCIATSGPGATNLTTGIATAYLDSIPMVALTGQVRTSLIGTDAFQEADIVGVTRSITKHNYLVNDIKDFPAILKEAFHIASSGRPGPVVVDIPVDISAGTLENYKYPEKVNIRGYKPNLTGHPGQIKKAAREIQQARKPVIYAGGGVIISGAHKELLHLAEKTNIPVTTTLLGLGIMPPDHPLYMGMPGMHGTQTANYALTESDLIIAVGARFDDRVTGNVKTFAPNARIIHIDIDPAAISKIIKVDIPVVGDACMILKKLNHEVNERQTNEWNDTINKWKKSYPPSYEDSNTVIKPQKVVERLCALAPSDALIATEVGQNQMWAAQYYKYRQPRQLLTSGGLGTMGYGLPAALGAQAAFPDRLVIDIAGDGSIQMNIQELTTAFLEKLPVKVAILNNSYLGMVRQWQELFWGKRYSSTCLMRRPECPQKCDPEKDCPPYVPDFIKIAESYN
ncbi:MAG TPA: biosynthetic-type acetolactate synthase large subunit, partial [Spirochaetota bacterium]|nr:biosynthetic-type acetolactate synthase large subunit [Spirochaetota bacterium]